MTLGFQTPGPGEVFEPPKSYLKDLSPEQVFGRLGLNYARV